MGGCGFRSLEVFGGPAIAPPKFTQLADKTLFLFWMEDVFFIAFPTHPLQTNLKMSPCIEPKSGEKKLFSPKQTETVIRIPWLSRYMEQFRSDSHSFLYLEKSRTSLPHDWAAWHWFWQFLTATILIESISTLYGPVWAMCHRIQCQFTGFLASLLPSCLQLRLCWVGPTIGF